MSIIVEIKVPNYSNPQSPFIVKVQANKNHGICDIIQGTLVPQEIVDEKKRKRTIKKFFPITRVSEVLSNFQGRQYDDVEVMEHLKNVLCETLNSAAV